MTTSVNIQELLTEIATQSRYGSLSQLRKLCYRILGPVNVHGKRVLEIGCGGGEMALLMAVEGASHVVGLEPLTEGSNQRVLANLERIRSCSAISNLKIIQTEFDSQIAEMGPFDVILGVNVINHIYETRRHLREDYEAWEAYQHKFKLMRNMLAINGACIFSDVAPKNAWRWLTRLGLPHPFTPQIEWDKHQQPSVWGEAFLESGFSGFSVDWVLPSKFGIDRLIRTQYAKCALAWFWHSYFIIRVR